MTKDEAETLIGKVVRQECRPRGLGRMFNIVLLVGVLDNERALILPRRHRQNVVVPLSSLSRSVKYTGHPTTPSAELG